MCSESRLGRNVLDLSDDPFSSPINIRAFG